MLITMSEKDIQRFKVLTDVREKRLRQVDAAIILNLSARLVNKLVSLGAQSLTQAARGRPSNRRYSEHFRIEILKLIREHYSDFSPTFTMEKLTERHNLSVSKETLRQWMIADGLWLPHSQRKPRVYQPRYRRDCLGELIQIDGSHHDWFEGHSDKCCLLVFIDDATGRLMNLRFSETESAFDYMLTTREYLNTGAC
ncbi:transposase [Vibrio lentus]|uniref:Transposase n=1 Tax=Vibrio lentus TaxID=136468 RepID=A0A2N7K8B2_9VIBR|nr:transposase [Vibrio lentus]